MESSSRKSHVVVNYSSSSYGGFLFRSPNSPPPSPSPVASPSISSLNHLFLSADIRTAPYRSLPSFTAGSLPQLRQPPLLPLPRSVTLPEPGTAAIAVRSRRAHPKRKAKASSGNRKADSRKEEGKSAAARAKEEGKMTAAAGEMERTVKEEAKDMIEESVFSKSPPPSSLPFPTFSLARPKAAVGAAGAAGASVGFCTVEAAAVAGVVDAGMADDLSRILRI
ncbi:hypothetical protein AXF42_Ash018090 [Apostasia shenzhenica]|uniref:Uncharacterized protein n=1 Tax=Apostasia shenzhenica TaxID=1088818 RepID=A0A2I0AVQ0_9ASPA|nr:hypothetical protein AXF42_Ash018090 [Apostasia shenzhenica]